MNSTQNNITLEQNLNLFRIIVALKNFLNSEQLKTDQKENLESNIRILETEVAGDKPTKEKVVAALSGIKEIIKDVAPGAALVMQITNFLNNLN